MNSSTTPANNETVAYGQLLALAGKLKRNDQINLVKALAGTLGMIAQFPSQLSPMVATGTAKPAKAGKAKEKGPAKQAPSNPLSGSPEKLAFDAAKKAVAKATKEGGGQKLASNHALVLRLEEAKTSYFRALSSAKGTKSAGPKGPADEAASSEDEATSDWAASRPAQPKAKAATPPKANGKEPIRAPSPKLNRK